MSTQSFLFGYSLLVLLVFTVSVEAIRLRDLSFDNHLRNEFDSINGGDHLKLLVKELLQHLPHVSSKHLHVHPHGKLYYLEPRLDEEDPWDNWNIKLGRKRSLPRFEKRLTDVGVSIENINRVRDIPILHSRPGADHVLYLDFDGESIPASSTAWNEDPAVDLNCPPYTIDDVTDIVSPDEIAVIKEVWYRVSEDYAPWNIDVTTERPWSFTDNICHVIITYGAPPLPGPDGGGIGFVDVHGNYENLYRPAFCYYNNLGESAQNIAECISHESGHNMGLEHDGSPGEEYYPGLGKWGTIMGNSYDKAITQWSKGEYEGATNTQDDIAVITSKIPYASPPTIEETSVNGCNEVNYLIGPTSRTASFDFNTDSPTVTVHADPIEGNMGNLDLSLILSCGDVVGNNAPTTSFSASVTASINSGITCTAFVSSSGDVSVPYSNYGSLGHLKVTVCGGYDIHLSSSVPLPPVTPTSPNPPPPPPPATAACCFYSEPEYRGGFLCVQAGQSEDLINYADLDNAISSLKCEFGVYPIIFEQPSYSGSSVYANCNAAFPSLVTTTYNLDNWISSIKVQSCTTGATIGSIIREEEDQDHFRPFTNINEDPITTTTPLDPPEPNPEEPVIPVWGWVLIAIGALLFLIILIAIASSSRRTRTIADIV